MVYVETIYYPSQAVLEAEKAAEREHQLGARPKVLVSERVVQLDLTLQGKAVGTTPLQEMMTRGMLLEPQMDRSQAGQVSTLGCRSRCPTRTPGNGNSRHRHVANR